MRLGDFRVELQMTDELREATETTQNAIVLSRVISVVVVAKRHRLESKLSQLVVLTDEPLVLC